VVLAESPGLSYKRHVTQAESILRTRLLPSDYKRHFPNLPGVVVQGSQGAASAEEAKNRNEWSIVMTTSRPIRKGSQLQFITTRTTFLVTTAS
jgi:hypothetical protein